MDFDPTQFCEDILLTKEEHENLRVCGVLLFLSAGYMKGRFLACGDCMTKGAGQGPQDLKRAWVAALIHGVGRDPDNGGMGLHWELNWTLLLGSLGGESG